jgi:hypothetical protein
MAVRFYTYLHRRMQTHRVPEKDTVCSVLQVSNLKAP